MVKKLLLKSLFVSMTQNVYHSIKALENVSSKEEGQERKTCLLVTSVQNASRRTAVISGFQKHKQDSQWLTCSVISN